MELIDTLKSKLKELDDKFYNAYMEKSVLDAESKRLEAYENWQPLLLKMWCKLHPDYEVNPHDLTVPLPKPLYNFVYVKSFSQAETLVVGETLQKYATSNGELAMALEELHMYRGFSPYKRKLFYDASLLMATEGHTLPKALDTVLGHLITDKLIISLEVGIRTGKLSETLTNFLEDLHYDIRNASRIKKAFGYPVIVASLIIAMCVAGKVWLLPQLFEPLGLSGDSLPKEVQPMIVIANLVLKPWNLIYLWLIYLMLKFLYKKSRNVAIITDIILLNTPVIGNYLVTKDVCFFFRNLYGYVNAGTPTTDAHIKSCDTLSVPSLRIIFEDKTNALIEGTSMATAYKTITYLRDDIKMILSVSETNGETGEALMTCTTMLKNSYQDVTDSLVEKIPAFSTLISGIVIITVFMPIMTILYNIDKYIV